MKLRDSRKRSIYPASSHEYFGQCGVFGPLVAKLEEGMCLDCGT